MGDVDVNASFEGDWDEVLNERLIEFAKKPSNLASVTKTRKERKVI